MRIVIIEDEPPIAEDIEAECRAILGKRIHQIKVFHTLEDAQSFLKTHSIDLCLLDLNLHGENGYEILKYTVSGSFQTIIISGYTDQAVEAFEYGVLDFIPKPINDQRLKKALERYLEPSGKKDNKLKYIVIHKFGKNHIIHLHDIAFFRAEGYLVNVYLKSGRTELINKSLTHLEKVLPENFIRVHRSFIVDMNEIIYYQHNKGGVYNIFLKDKTILPLGRKYNHVLKNLLIK